MTNKPTIAILGGTGHEGTGLALRWASNGYEVIIGSRKEEKALQVTRELNDILGKDLIRGMDNSSAAREADINVLTVVATAHEAALTGLKDDLQGKVLVDATARIK
ncbi:MAG: NAD(P)-binding domain-containing protein, partial [Anaerolineales bacterium]